uniref:Protein NDRG2 n=1 Tax=Monodelphis domestica TaxID=13616 RepID=A0A5F8HHI9_MONDO
MSKGKLGKVLYSLSPPYVFFISPIPSQATMSELQEVSITEEKPLLPGKTLEDVKEAELAAQTLLDAGQTHSVETPFGSITFTVFGIPKPKRPAILTYHDVGLNYKTCFKPLFDTEDMQEIIKNFVRVHVEAPGMEEGAPVFPLGYQYPSLDQLADMIPFILQFLNFSTIVGFGVGAGAYVLSRYALSHPDQVEGLVLVNLDSSAKGWMDWAAHKLTGLTSSVSDMILEHLFSQEELSGSSELVQQYRNIIVHAPNLENIELFWNSFNNRRDLHFDRRGDTNLRCPVMLVVGDQAPYEDAVVECNSKLDPTTTSFLKMADSGGQPQLTQPVKLTEALKYFLQGMGYMASSCMTRLSRSRTSSLTSNRLSRDDGRPRASSRTSDSGSIPAESPGQSMEGPRPPTSHSWMVSLFWRKTWRNVLFSDPGTFR